ncbi:Nn.00g013180.m01.CDS01 [Neocucurbitaria sp. VM-36]
MEEDGPKWILEHASTNKAVCNQASCKSRGVKIATGELRIGTHTLFDRDGETRWYYAWRHWGCATTHQIKGLKETTNNDPTKAPGYERLSVESQEQVQLAFEKGKPIDKEFKGIREDLAKSAPRYAQEYRNAEGYKVDVAKRAAGCRGQDCLYKGTKIVKGELRLGLAIPFDGEHVSWVYKQWQCMSRYDLDSAKEHYENDSFGGLDDIPTEFRQTVEETFKKGEVVKPPELEVEALPVKKKPRTKKQKVNCSDDEELTEGKKSKKSQVKKEAVTDGEDVEAPKPKRTRKKRAIEEVDVSEEEYVPRKTRSRQAPVVETDPAVANIQALAEKMREEAAK